MPADALMLAHATGNGCKHHLQVGHAAPLGMQLLQRIKVLLVHVTQLLGSRRVLAGLLLRQRLGSLQPLLSRRNGRREGARYNISGRGKPTSQVLFSAMQTSCWRHPP